MELSKRLHEKTLETLRKLDLIWNEIGLDDETRQQRQHMFVEHVEELYNDMLVEAESSKVALLDSIKSIGKELCALKRDLQMEITIDGYENESLHIAKQKLKKKLETYQDIYNARKAEITKLKSQQAAICDALGKRPKELNTSPLPAKEQIQEFRNYLEELSDLKFQREEQFLKHKTRVVAIMDELQIKPSLDFERRIVQQDDSSFKVTDENMKQLHNLHKSLENQLIETKLKIADLRESITSLWERLEESPQVRSAFLEAHPGNSINTLMALKAELCKLEEKKKANIKLFVDKLREDLVVWWSKCCCSPEEQHEFMHFTSDCYTEDLLTLHEMQLEKLKSHYEQNIAIYNMYNKRESLWEKLLDLEHRANQPNRYKNRGGQLLNEEKERKTINAQLPKIENELLDLVNQYELLNGKQFLIHGKRLQELIEESWKERDENKRLKLSVKKKLREQTPCKLTLPPSGRATPMNSNSKRKLFTPATEVSKRSRIDVTAHTTRSVSKITSYLSTNKTKSFDRQKRLESIKKRSRVNDTNYQIFEIGLETKSTCRSSLFPDRMTTRSQIKKIVVDNPGNTPRKALSVVNTPQRTPLRTTFRSKSPILSTPRLTVQTNNLPIII